MKGNIEERACELAAYIIENRTTVREAARRFGISKSTVHKDIQERLPIYNRSLYLQVKDYQQVLAAARTSLAVEEDSFAAAQLKFEQGTISQNALLEAKDKVSAAQETVDGAEIDLFSAYNNYRWAVDRGILN